MRRFHCRCQAARWPGCPGSRLKPGCPVSRLSRLSSVQAAHGEARVSSVQAVQGEVRLSRVQALQGPGSRVEGPGWMQSGKTGIFQLGLCVSRKQWRPVCQEVTWETCCHSEVNPLSLAVWVRISNCCRPGHLAGQGRLLSLYGIASQLPSQPVAVLDVPVDYGR